MKVFAVRKEGAVVEEVMGASLLEERPEGRSGPKILHENYSNEHHQVEDRQGQLLECSTAVRALPTVSFVYCDHHSILLTNLFYICQGT